MTQIQSMRGQILLMTLIFFGVFLALGSALMGYVLQYSTSGKYLVATRQAHYLAEGGIDLAAYRLNTSPGYAGETDTPLGTGTVSISVENINSSTKQVTATAYVPNRTNPIATRTVKAQLAINTSVVSFHFGVQVGNGGLSMDNNSEVNGNVYSNGSISGSGRITGDATVAGGEALSGVQVYGTAWANSLSNCVIGGDALYQSISNCAVSGTTYPGTESATVAEMPISDEQIDEWESLAQEGGVIEGNYAVTGSQNLGPLQINGDLTVNGTLYLTGPVWVRGDITFSNNSGLITHASLGSSGAVLIADSPGNESSTGQVQLSNNMTISGNGNSGSFPMVLSTNTSGSAIQLSNNAAGVILYAPNGTVQVSNNAGANQITAHRLHLNNNATIEYMTGLQNQSFSNGPGGSWAFVPGSYSSAR